MRATFIPCPADEAYACCLRFLETAIAACKAGKPFTEELSSPAAGLQEWIFDCALHPSKSGTCCCAHHKLAYRLGELAEFPEEIKDMVGFLKKTRASLLRLIAKPSKAIKALKKAGISKAQ
jgi:hypothetical protein